MDYEETLNKIYDLVKRHSNLFGKSSYDISILPGWIPLVDTLLDVIQNELKETEHLQIVQIRESNGSLRFSFGTKGVSEERAIIFHRLVGITEHKSEKVCSLCGAPGKIEGDLWVSTKCEQHRGKRSAFDNYSVSVGAKHEDRMAKLLKLA